MAALCLLTSVQVHARRPRPAPAPAPTVAELVQRAQGAAQRGDFPTAADTWEQAYAQQPNPEYQLFLGEAAEHIPGPVGAARAMRAYRRFLREESQPNPGQRDQAVEHLRLLAGRVPSGGVAPVRGVVPLTPPLPPPPPRFEPAQRLSLTIPPGGGPRRADPGRRTAATILLGAGALLLATGGVFVVSGLSAQGRGDAATDPLAMQEQYGTATGWFGGAGACMGLGVAAVVAGGVLFGTAGRAVEPRHLAAGYGAARDRTANVE